MISTRIPQALAIFSLGLTITMPLFASAVVGGGGSSALDSKEVADLAIPAFGKFNYLRSGEMIGPNHPLVTAGELTVNVTFEEVHEAFFAENMRVFINGRDISEIDPSSYQVTGTPPTGTEIYGEIGGEVRIPVGLDRNYPLVNLTAELVHHDTGVVIAREKAVMYENVVSDLSLDKPGGQHTGYHYQLTNVGLGGASFNRYEGLETQVSDVLPAPDLETFSNQFGEAVEGIPPEQESDLNACINYNDLGDDRFSDPDLLPAYGRALTEAKFVFNLYKTCRANNGAAACLAICVRKKPKPKHFKLCVDTLTAKPVGGEISGPTTAQLDFLDSTSVDNAAMTADVLIEDILADVDVNLSELSVKFRKVGVGCPVARVSEEEIQEAWLAAFATCNAYLTVDDAYTPEKGNSRPTYAMSKLEQAPGKLAISEATEAAFRYRGVTENADVGACALNFIKSTAEELVGTLTPQVLEKVGEAFNAGHPRSMLPNTLDDALAELPIDRVNAVAVDTIASIESVSSSRRHGLVLNYATDFIPDLSLDRGYPLPFHVTQEASVFEPLRRSQDQYGDTVASYTTMSIGWLNYQQWAKGVSGLLNSTLEFTPEQLGAYAQGASTTIFDGELLFDLHPALKGYDGQPMEVVMHRNMDPFFYLDPDPSITVPLLGTTLNYFIDDVRVRFKAPDEELPNGDVIEGETFLELVASLYESDFLLTHYGVLGRENLDAALLPDPQSSYLFQKLRLDMIDFDLAECPKYKHELGDTGPACEREVESAIRAFLESNLAGRLADLVTDIPAPQYFSLENNEIQSERQLDHQNRNQRSGRIGLSGVLP